MDEKNFSYGSVIDSVRENTETDLKKPDFSIGLLSDCLDTLFKARDGVCWAQPTEKGYSGDGASLYIIITLEDEKEEASLKLMKLGWGEFSHQTFTKNQNETKDHFFTLHSFPAPIFCVSQYESFLASKEILKEMEVDPIGYLRNHTLFMANQGRVYESEKIDFNHRLLDKKIKPVPYEEMLAMVRNQIVEKYSSPEEFRDFLQTLPGDPEELSNFISNCEKPIPEKTNIALESLDTKEQKQRSLFWILKNMGTDTRGYGRGIEELIDNIISLKNSFNFETKQFA